MITLICATLIWNLGFSQIMPIHVERFKEIIKRECGNKGILISDHYYRDVLEISNLLFLLSEGIIYRIHHPEELRELGYIPYPPSLCIHSITATTPSIVLTKAR